MHKGIPVSEIMSSRVIVANSSHSFSQVCRLFLERRIHHLPIVNGENNTELIGIISSSDVLEAYRYRNTSGDDEMLDKQISLESIMTRNPISISPNDTIGHAAEVFATQKIQALPVIEAGQIKGIITTNDLIKHFAVAG